MKEIGIMQGRLSLPYNGKIQSFPKLTWRQEFYKAAQAGLSHIEWIFEADEWGKNPLSSGEGINEIKEVIKETEVSVKAVCADYFMDVPYLISDSNLRKELQEKLVWLINQASRIGASFIDIPFVDASEIPSRMEFQLVDEFIKNASELASKLNLVLTLETSLNPVDFKDLLTMINHPNVMANYDTGNSSGIGYNCIQELSAYGKWIRTVHIKDRLLNNGTMPLGNGSADFDSFFKMLSKVNYKGPIILQAAREEENEELSTAIKNRKFVENYLQKYNI